MVISICFLSVLAPCDALRTRRLPVMTIRVGDYPVRAELALTPEDRSRGLMYRGSLGKDEGMLFVYPTPRTLSFWMKNTLIPLDVGYFDGDGFLIEVRRMKVEKGTPEGRLPTYLSSEPARYALEMNAGWYAGKKIRKYSRLRLPRDLTSIE